MSSTSEIRPIKLTNSLTGKKEILTTQDPRKLSFYSCGPTVYNFIHIGNLRSGLVADMFFRYFKRVGYEVNFVRNYTDIDDRIIQQSIQEKIPASDVAKKYTQEVEKDFAVAGLLEPTHKPTATGHVDGIISLIEELIKNGKAYVVDGEVLYAIDQFPTYGKLSHKLIDDLLAGARVEINQKKKNPLDFTLWKPAKPGEPSWDSPWGKGRPGWHIECSAMVKKCLGDQIDVHHGGEDLIFPHHENEIAQSEGAIGKAPFARYGVHHAFVNLNKEKMSKSVGNVFLARDFLTKFSGEFARYMLLSMHYRHPIDFGPESIEQTLTALTRLYEAKLKAVEAMKQVRARADLRAEGMWGSFAASCEAARKEIDECFANDLNTSGALGALFTLIREFNKIMAEPLAQATPSVVLCTGELIKVIEEDIGGVLGIGRMNPEAALADLTRIRASRAEASGAAPRPTEAEILSAIDQRANARKSKDFAQADQIRKDLEARGVLIKDGPKGTTWEYQ